MHLYVVVYQSLSKTTDGLLKILAVDLFNSAICKSEMYQISPQVKTLSVGLGFGFIFCAIGCIFKHFLETTKG